MLQISHVIFSYSKFPNIPSCNCSFPHTPSCNFSFPHAPSSNSSVSPSNIFCSSRFPNASSCNIPDTKLYHLIIFHTAKCIKLSCYRLSMNHSIIFQIAPCDHVFRLSTYYPVTFQIAKLYHVTKE